MINKSIGLALKNLWAYKVRSIFVTMGITLGSAMFILVNSAGPEYKEHVVQRVEKFGLNNMYVFPFMGKLRMPPGSDNSVTSLTLEDAHAIEQEINGIKYVSPVRMRPAVEFKFENRSTNASLHAVTSMWELVANFKTVKGETITSEDVQTRARVCLLGQTVAKELFERTPALGEQILIRNVKFRIKGLLESKGAAPGRMGDMDNKVVIPISTFKTRLYDQDHLNLLGMTVFDRNKMDGIEKQLIALFRERHRIAKDMEDDFAIRRPVNLIKMLTKTSDKLELLLNGLAGVSFLLSGSVIMNIMLISIRDRKVEIGLRKAMGANSQDIFWQFLLESSIIVLPGALAGFGLAQLSTHFLYSLIGIQTSLSLQATLLGIFIGVFVGIIFGIVPSRRASNLTPIEALRS